MDTSEWVQRNLGTAAGALRDAVLEAIPRAHDDAVSAQAVSGTRKQDPYGHTMKNRQHECLVELGRLIDGVEVVRPRGASFELLQVSATKTVLYPWRYANSLRVSRTDARMRPSQFRTGLLSTGEPATQLTLEPEHADLSEEELATLLAERDALAQFGSVVTVGYASGPAGLFGLGWGVLELRSGGSVEWNEWEPLPLTARAAASQDSAGTVTLRRADARAPDHLTVPRFDQTGPLVDDFGLTPRNPLAGEPTSDGAAEDDETGTDQNRR